MPGENRIRAAGYSPPGNPFAHGDDVRLQAVLPEEEQLGGPDAGLDLVRHGGHVVLPAQRICLGEEVLLQPHGPVVHQDDLVEERRHLVPALVPLRKDAPGSRRCR